VNIKFPRVPALMHRAERGNQHMSLRVVIVDDEPAGARTGAYTFLAEEPDVEIVAECADGAEAVNRIEQLRPDVLVSRCADATVEWFEVLEAIDARRCRWSFSRRRMTIMLFARSK